MKYNNVKNQVWGQMRNPLWQQTQVQIQNEIHNHVWCQILYKVWDQTWNSNLNHHEI